MIFVFNDNIVITRPQMICAHTWKLVCRRAQLVPTNTMVYGATGAAPASTDGTICAGGWSITPVSMEGHKTGR
jgi:hypothetical protein